MSRKKKEGKKKWKFFWKNVDGLGRLLRMGAGALMMAGASQMKDDPTNAALLGMAGAYLFVGGFLRWCSLRALLKKPTRRAYLRHYPEEA